MISDHVTRRNRICFPKDFETVFFWRKKNGAIFGTYRTQVFQDSILEECRGFIKTSGLGIQLVCEAWPFCERAAVCSCRSGQVTNSDVEERGIERNDHLKHRKNDFPSSVFNLYNWDL